MSFFSRCVFLLYTFIFISNVDSFHLKQPRRLKSSCLSTLYSEQSRVGSNEIRDTGDLINGKQHRLCTQDLNYVKLKILMFL